MKITINPADKTEFIVDRINILRVYKIHDGKIGLDFSDSESNIILTIHVSEVSFNNVFNHLWNVRIFGTFESEERL